MAIATQDSRFEIVSIDSMQVYRGMDIGTAKPSAHEQRRVPHHLIDLCEPSEEMSIVEFTAAYDRAVADIMSRGKVPLLVGGTGLYLRAVVDRLTPPPQYPEVVADLEQEPDTAALHNRLVGLDPLAASKMEPTNRRRVVRALSVTIGSGKPFSSFGPGLDTYQPVDVMLIGIDVERPLLDRRIDERYAAQLDSGFLDEVATMLACPGGPSRTASQALGYKELAMHLSGELSLQEGVDLASKRTRKFARRQQRWFRRDPRIEWLHHAGDTDVIVQQLLARLR